MKHLFHISRRYSRSLDRHYHTLSAARGINVDYYRTLRFRPLHFPPIGELQVTSRSAIFLQLFRSLVQLTTPGVINNVQFGPSYGNNWNVRTFQVCISVYLQYVCNRGVLAAVRTLSTERYEESLVMSHIRVSRDSIFALQSSINNIALRYVHITTIEIRWKFCLNMLKVRGVNRDKPRTPSLICRRTRSDQSWMHVIVNPIVREDTVAWFRIIPKKTRRRKIVQVRLVPLLRTRRESPARLRGGARVTKGSLLPTAVEYERVRASPEQLGVPFCPLCVTFSWKFSGRMCCRQPPPSL